MNDSKIVAITGASSGIGHATALHLADLGHTIVAGARRTTELADLESAITESGGTCHHRRLDVTDLADFQHFVDDTVDRYGRLDVIINNAGVMPLSPLAALHVDEWNQMIDVNIRGVLHGITAALPIFQQQRSGHFVNVSSIGAYAVSPTAAVYCATKYAVRALTDGLRQEVGPDIRTTSISPGVTESELASTITDATARDAMSEYRRIALPADAIAHAIAYAIAQPSTVDVNEMIIRPPAAI